MDHRKVRSTVHGICDGFYTRIKDEKEWDEVNKISQEYHQEYEDNEFALDMVRALVAEWCRENMEDGLKDKPKRKAVQHE